MPKTKRSPKTAKKKVNDSAPATRDHAPLERELLKRLYSEMLRARVAQQSLRKSGKHSGFNPASGREAIEVGCAIDLQPDDVLLCPANSLVAPMVVGIPLTTILSSGTGPASPDNDSPAKGHTLFLSRSDDELAVAAGVGYSLKLQKKPNAVFALDAGTTPARGVEALSLLARERLPVIAVVENRGGNPERLFAAARDHKIPIITVDANDVVAVYRVAREALFRARTNRGATVIDCYPLPLPGGRSEDPLTAMEHYMQRFNCWSDLWRDQLLREFNT